VGRVFFFFYLSEWSIARTLLVARSKENSWRHCTIRITFDERTLTVRDPALRYCEECDPDLANLHAIFPASEVAELGLGLYWTPTMHALGVEQWFSTGGW